MTVDCHKRIKKRICACASSTAADKRGFVTGALCLSCSIRFHNLIQTVTPFFSPTVGSINPKDIFCQSASILQFGHHQHHFQSSYVQVKQQETWKWRQMIRRINRLFQTHHNILTKGVFYALSLCNSFTIYCRVFEKHFSYRHLVMVFNIAFKWTTTKWQSTIQGIIHLMT